MLELLYDPLIEIQRVKRQSYSRVFLYLLASSLFASCGILFGWMKYTNSADMLYYAPVILFAMLAVFIVFAFFLSVALHVLDGKGGYYEGLSMTVLGVIAPSIAMFFGGALLFIPYGWFFASVVAAYGFVLGTATFFRAGKELFNLEYAGVFIGWFIAELPWWIALLLFYKF